MAKNVYSLVLSDAVVAAVDLLAAQEGYSRSALVNHILAEYASVASPQGQARTILASIQDITGRHGLRPYLATAGSLTLRTSLPYKYNPALSYAVELWSDREHMGQLRVSMRSQNEALLAYFKYFFTLWAGLEEKHTGGATGTQRSRLEDRRYSRNLRAPAGSDEDLGEAIADYICLMDSCMKVFFGNLDNAPEAVKQTERQYTKQIRHNSNLMLL